MATCELENIGLIPEIGVNEVKNAENLAKSLIDGGLNCALVSDKLAKEISKKYPKMLLNPSLKEINCQKLSIPEELIKSEDWAGITKYCREAVDKMLGFTMVHVGLNCANPEEAEAVADEFDTAFGFTKKVGNSSVFASTYMEMMKKPFKGTNGHIAIATTSVKCALYHLALRGFEVDETSIKYNAEGIMNVAYLKHEFGGFAVHLVLKK